MDFGNPAKIVIPQRAYNPPPRPPAPAAEEVKRPAGKIKANNAPYAFDRVKAAKEKPAKGPPSDKFEDMRNYVRKRLERQIATLKKEAEDELVMISDLEKKWISSIEAVKREANRSPRDVETLSVHSEGSFTPANPPLLPNKLNYPNVYMLANSNKGGLVVYSKGLETPHTLNLPQFNKGMQAMCLDMDNVLVAGGNERTAFIFRISSDTIHPLGKMVESKRFFALSYVNGLPAAIGGISETSQMIDTVEILVEGSWKMDEPLTMPRSHTVSIYYLGLTYVFGGVSPQPNMTIECFDNGWKLIDVKIPMPIRFFGACGYGGSIFLLGGELISGTKVKKVFEFSVEQERFVSENSMEHKFASHTYGSVVCVDGVFFMLDYESKLILTYLR
jgi:hypothetical protein